MTAASATRLRSQYSRIGDKIGPTVLPFHPTPAALGKIRAIALALGCSESSAHKKLYGPHAVNLETATILEELIRRGDTQDAAAFEAPITAAMMGETLPSLTDAVNSHNRSDAIEDVCQAAFIKNASDAELSGWIKGLAADLHSGEVLLSCLMRERETRQEAK